MELNPYHAGTEIFAAFKVEMLYDGQRKMTAL
jgi:hypothetical protein